MLETWANLLKLLNRCQNQFLILEHSNSIVCLNIKIDCSKSWIYSLPAGINWCGNQCLTLYPIIYCVSIIVKPYVQVVLYFQIDWFLNDFFRHLIFVMRWWDWNVFWLHSELYWRYFPLISILTITRSQRILPDLQLVFQCSTETDVKLGDNLIISVKITRHIFDFCVNHFV